jgi:hypothetical protein
VDSGTVEGPAADDRFADASGVRGRFTAERFRSGTFM